MNKPINPGSQSHDPKVRAAMAEVLEVLRKYDLAGHVLIYRENGWIETRLRLPEWSILKVEENGGETSFRIKTEGRSVEDVDATVGLLRAILTNLGGLAMSAGDLLAMLKASGLDFDFEEYYGPSAPKWDFT
jgi:hypothetical protein